MKKKVNELRQGDLLLTLIGWQTVKKTQYWKDNVGVDVHTVEGDIIGYTSESIEVDCKINAVREYTENT